MRASARKIFMLASVILCLSGLRFAAPFQFAAAETAPARILNVANWSDYIDPAGLAEFTRESGIRIVYDVYDSNEMLETRLLAGATGYDLVAPSSSYLQRQIKAGLYRPLDKALLPGFGQLDGAIMARLESADPGARIAMPYMWSTTGLAFNVKKVTERLGPGPHDSWSLLFDPDKAARLRDCGIYVLDTPEEGFAAAAFYLGIDPHASAREDIAQMARALARVRPFIRKFHSSEYINALANGDICLAMSWAGDALQARARANEAGNGVEIAYVTPREGALLSIDSFAIPKDAAHVSEAHAFLEFLMRPDIAARNSALTNFATPIAPARALLDAALRDDAAMFPPPEMMAKLRLAPVRAQDLQKLISREWTRVKLGR